MSKSDRSREVLKCVVKRIANDPDSFPVAYTREHYARALQRLHETLMIASRLTVWQLDVLAEMLRMAHYLGQFDGLPPGYNPVPGLQPQLPELLPELGGEG